MHLLIKTNGQPGLAAHIADINGDPLCNIKIKRADWQICETAPCGVVVCYHCKRAQSHKTCVVWKDSDSPSVSGTAG